jgi:hypothetical protein
MHLYPHNKRNNLSAISGMQYTGQPDGNFAVIGQSIQPLFLVLLFDAMEFSLLSINPSLRLSFHFFLFRMDLTTYVPVPKENNATDPPFDDFMTR